MSLERRTPLGPGKAALERGSSFKAAPKPLARSPLKPLSDARTDRAGEPEGPRPIEYATQQALRRRKRKTTKTTGAGKAAWGESARSRPCAACGTRATQGHHIVTQQELRKAVMDNPLLSLPKIRWDRRNLLPLCHGCHASHHSRARPLSMAVLMEHAPEVVAFAAEVGRAWWLVRTYPGLNPYELETENR